LDVKLFKKQFSDVEDRFPKLRYIWSEEFLSMVIIGKLDICDRKGVFWDSYDILLITGKNYPFSVPILIETSKKVPHDEERHISKEGICCMDMDHKLLKVASKGIHLCQFILDYVYPFFANQLYYDQECEYADGEWSHHFEGIVEFYHQELQLSDPVLIVKFLEQLLTNSLPPRNSPCLCGSKKYKDCKCKQSIDFLKGLPTHRLQEDLEGFRKLI
tara:strand:+ start:1249 stop:1896 length:648 start_codon:yes stop_codon:yes gene_type:complete